MDAGPGTAAGVRTQRPLSIRPPAPHPPRTLAPSPLLQGVANRDIKLENTLLDGSPRPLIKICDFGYSKHEKFQSAPGSRVGTPAYLAPEVITAKDGATYDGAAADVWSCGVLLYVMVAGAYPFRRQNDDTMRPEKHRMDELLKVGVGVEASHGRAAEGGGACF